MDIRMAKRIIGRKVRYNGNIYTLNACILRKNENGWFYQAELKELAANSVTITLLESVEDDEVNANEKH